VTGGEGLLEPPGPEEQELLELLAAPKNGRLACQARIKRGKGVIRIVAVEV
jgi:ferredoxin